MYWSRTGSLVGFFIFGVLCIFWALGGWLLVAHSGRFRRRENLIAGIASGLLLFILFSNLLSHFLDSYIAFIMAGVLILALGLWATWRSGRRFVYWSDLRVWPQILALLGMMVLFTLLMRGLGVGDDYAHLPLVSLMATGDIPPHYSLYPDILLPYHYGLDLFAAGIVRIGGFFPWSAWDLSRAFVVSLALVCVWLWLRRITQSRTTAFVGSALIAFGMGTRWILTLLPSSWIADISSNIHLIGSSLATGDTFAQALFRPWIIDGGPPVPIPFAFANGIMNPLTFSWGGSASLPFLAIILILMISGRRILRPIGMLILGGAILSLALSAEYIYILISLGIGLAVFVIFVVEKQSVRQIISSCSGQLLLIALVTVAISFVQGGVITELVRTYITRRHGVTDAAMGIYSIRWPPAFYDSHLGSLSPANWRQLIVFIAECGPILLLFIVVVLRMKNDFTHHRTIEFGFAIASFIGIVIPLFVNYYYARDITRFTGFGLTMWLLLSVQPLLEFTKHASLWNKAWVGLGCAITIFGGIVLLVYQCTAIFTPQVSSFINSMDSRMSQDYWGRLDLRLMVFDPVGYRSQTLFGRLSIDSITGFPLTEFVPYLTAPDPHDLRKLGFGYVYLDKHYWDRLSSNYQQALYSSCTRVLKRLEKYNSATGELSDFRVLIDITSCK